MLIYNFPATFTGRLNSTFEQSYLFETDVDYGKYDGGRIGVLLV